MDDELFGGMFIFARDTCLEFAQLSEGQHFNVIHDPEYAFNRGREPIVPGLLTMAPLIAGLDIHDDLDMKRVEAYPKTVLSANRRASYKAKGSENGVEEYLFQADDDKIRWNAKVGDSGVLVEPPTLGDVIVEVPEGMCERLEEVICSTLPDGVGEDIRENVRSKTDGLMPFLCIPRALNDLLYPDEGGVIFSEIDSELGPVLRELRQRYVQEETIAFNQLSLRRRIREHAGCVAKLKYGINKLDVDGRKFEALLWATGRDADDRLISCFEVKAKGFVAPANYLVQESERLDGKNVSVKRTIRQSSVAPDYKIPNVHIQTEDKPVVVIVGTKSDGIGFSVGFHSHYMLDAHIVIGSREASRIKKIGEKKRLSYERAVRKSDDSDVKREDYISPAEDMIQKSWFFDLDVTDEDSVHQFDDFLREKFGRADYLVYGAAYMNEVSMGRSRTVDIDPNHELEAFKVCVQGYRHLVEHVSGIMDGGHVMYLSTGHGRVVPGYNIGHIKGAGEQLTLQMAADFGAREGNKGIRCNILCVPPVSTYSSMSVPYFADMLDQYKAGAFLDLPSIEELGIGTVHLLQVPGITAHEFHLDGGHFASGLQYNITDVKSLSENGK